MSTEQWTVRRLLEWTSGFFARRQVDAPRLSAELLLGHVLAVPRIRLYMDYERPLGEGDLRVYRELVRRAGEHEPIAYLTGRVHFFSLELEIEPGVLIPRPDTETLVEDVLQMARHTVGMESPRVLDLCTGSGCIALAIASNLKGANVIATDINPGAVALARRNAEKLKLGDRVRVLEGDLSGPLTDLVDVQPFDLIVANPPYIPSAQIPQLDRNVKDYEPLSALDGGLDGLAVHRRILDQAPGRLVGGGRIYLEIAFDQGDLARALFAAHAAFDEVRLLKDYGGKDRVVTARKRP